MKHSVSKMERQMYESVGHIVEIRFIDGTLPFIGKCVGFTQALDNEPEIASIDIDIEEKGEKRLYELMENEISEIIFLN